MDERAETPEPSRVQGRRNNTGVQLLDGEGGISDQVRRLPALPRFSRSYLLFSKLEVCLKHIFGKYCIPPAPVPLHGDNRVLLVPPEGAYLSQEGLDAWARDTNGAPFSQETKEELVEFLDVTDDGELTYVSLLRPPGAPTRIHLQLQRLPADIPAAD